MNKVKEFLLNHMSKIFDGAIVLFIVYGLFFMTPTHKDNPVLKEYKDGIQNHLAWDNKGQCFFVRPNDDVTVYLIRVQDCDKK